MSDEFEEAVSRGTDVDLTPDLHEGESPLISSGVSSVSPLKGASPSQPSQPDGKSYPSYKTGKQNKKLLLEAQEVFKCIHPKCSKVYKRKKGLENHIFVHKIQDISQRKPKKEEVMPLVHGFIINILKEILEEPHIPLLKKDLVSELINSSHSSAWDEFVKVLSDMIVDCLTARSKVMPSNQYEDFLSKLMLKLNTNYTFENIKIALKLILKDDNLKNCEYVEMIVLRLCLRLTDCVQQHIAREMTELPSTSGIEPTPMSDKEESQLRVHLKNLLQHYFAKTVVLKGPVWRARSLCLRSRFFCNEDGDSVTEKEIMDNSVWVNGSVILSENTVKFFVALEMLVRSVYSETGKLGYDLIMDKIFLFQNSPLLNLWHLLVTGYLAEVDALVFMKEIVGIFVLFTIRKEEKRLQGIEENKAKLAKHSLRGNLQRN